MCTALGSRWVEVLLSVRRLVLILVRGLWLGSIRVCRTLLLRSESAADVRASPCRGVATFPEGVPEPPGTLRMIWSARGVRVGISSISRTQCFWFTTLTCPEVCPLPSALPATPM